MRRDPFQAIADPVRRDIIALLYNEPMTVMQVVNKFDLTRPGITKHLHILKACGVIKMTRHGREQLCSIETDGLRPAFTWLEKYYKEWNQRNDSVDFYVNELLQLNAYQSRDKFQERKKRKK
jgi:DNA-binding transcriptional ArsR family regulator